MLDNNHHYSLGVTCAPRGGTFIVHIILCVYYSTAVLHNKIYTIDTSNRYRINLFFSNLTHLIIKIYVY